MMGPTFTTSLSLFARAPVAFRGVSAGTCTRPRHTPRASLERKVVLYDGVCGLCNGGIQWLLRLDRKEKLKFAALQSESGRALLEEAGAPDDLSTVVYIRGDTAYTYSDAVLRIGEELDLPLAASAAMARVLVPQPMRDLFYTDVVAKNRYRVFGKSDSCTLLQPGYEHRFLQ